MSNKPTSLSPSYRMRWRECARIVRKGRLTRCATSQAPPAAQGSPRNCQQANQRRIPTANLVEPERVSSQGTRRSTTRGSGRNRSTVPGREGVNGRSRYNWRSSNEYHGPNYRDQRRRRPAANGYRGNQRGFPRNRRDDRFRRYTPVHVRTHEILNQISNLVFVRTIRH